MITPILNFPGYFINRDGKVFTDKIPGAKGKRGSKIIELKGSINNNGYKRVNLRANNKNNPLSVHRLVAITFIENPKSLPIINHKDGDKLNNQVSNLEWCTSSDNNKHAIYSGMVKSLPNSLKLDQVKVTKIRSEYNDFINQIKSEYQISRRQVLRVLQNKNWYDKK